MKNKPELLMPAGNLEGLKTAILYGADAVYIGAKALSLRARADNFDLETIRGALCFAHSHRAKVYVAVNIFAHNEHLKQIQKYLEELSHIHPDALIISDPGVFLLAQKICPDVDIHISTQLSSTNYESFLFWEEHGAKRVVCARELSLEEISDIRDRLEEEKVRKNSRERIKIEAFVHGSMCMSYSGRCLLSSYMAFRSANLGECTHPCRWKYALMEETRPGEYFSIEEDEGGTYILNSKDLCMIEYIDKLAESGVDAFKVEGRMKSELYIATVARVYRRAIDDYFKDPSLYCKTKEFYLEQISKCTYREFSTGFYFKRPDKESQIYDGSTYVKNYIFLGKILDIDKNGLALIEQKNKFSVGDKIEILRPDLNDVSVMVDSLWDADTGNRLLSCPHPKERLKVSFSDDQGRKVVPEQYVLLARPCKKDGASLKSKLSTMTNQI